MKAKALVQTLFGIVEFGTAQEWETLQINDDTNPLGFEDVVFVIVSSGRFDDVHVTGTTGRFHFNTEAVAVVGLGQRASTHRPGGWMIARHKEPSVLDYQIGAPQVGK